MTKYSKGMTNCMGSLSQLSESELKALAKETEKEIANRNNLHRKADITNAIVAIQKVSKYCDYLEVEEYFVETEGGTLDIELSEIEAALKRLLF